MVRITELQNRQLSKLKPIKFKCDKKLGCIPKPLPNLTSFMVFIGLPRSGKTSLMVSLLTSRKPRIYRGVFDNIILVMPSHSIASLKHNPFKDLDENKIYNELNFENLSQIFEQIQEYADEDENTVLIIDDMTSELKNGDIQNLLAQIIQNRRHLHVSIWILSQNYLSIPLTPLRKLINYLIFFKPSSAKERNCVFDELAITIPKDDIVTVSKYIWDNSHSFMYLDVLNQKIYKKFNEIKLSNDNDNNAEENENESEESV